LRRPTGRFSNLWSDGRVHVHFLVRSGQPISLDSRTKPQCPRFFLDFGSGSVSNPGTHQNRGFVRQERPMSEHIVQPRAAPFQEMLEAERLEVQERRQNVEPPLAAAGDDPAPCGLALSGGGIRSASFNLGVLQAFFRAGLLRHVDYLSTVSGGGYIGSYLCALF